MGRPGLPRRLPSSPSPSGSDAGADALRLIGAGALGAGLFLAARRSIPARIATSASAILLLVVLGVSVGLSAVLAENVEDEAANRLESEARTEAAIAAEAGRTALASAAPSARALGTNAPAPSSCCDQLRDPANAAALQDDVQLSLQGIVDQLIAGIDPSYGPILLVSPDAAAPRRLGVVAPVGAVLDEPTLAQLQSNAVVERGDPSAMPSGSSIVTAGNTAYGLAAAPVRIPDGTGRSTAAVLVVTSRLDDGYLAARAGPRGSGDERGLAIVSRSGVITSDGAVGAGARDGRPGRSPPWTAPAP